MKVALFTKSCWTGSSKYLPYQLLENGGNFLTGFHKSSSCRSCARLVASLTENRYSRQNLFISGASMATAATTSKDGYIPDDQPRPPNTTVNNHDQPMLKLNKVAVVGKMTRYEFEKLRYKDYSEEEFKSMLRNRGSNYENLLMQHKKHVQTMEKLMEVLKQRGIEYRICTRGQSEYSKVAVDWADAIITAGGDGTFLSAASKILSRTKPLIGINTDTERSEGHLCLPAKYSHNINEALDKISQSRFRWLYRQRLRITMTGTEENFEPLENGYILQHRMRDRLQRTASTYFSIDDSDDDSFIIDRKKQQRPGTPSGYQQG
uniref:NAD(+) kinase n=2 Tax=Ciona savignyi TaxID=51511 RepID=H2Y9V5_CIOSA